MQVPSLTQSRHEPPKKPRRAFASMYRSVAGNVSLELALVLPFLLLLVMGAYDFGRGFMEKQRLNGAARAGAQYALMHYNKDTATLYDGVEQSAQHDAEDVHDVLQVISNVYCRCLDDTVVACGASGSCTGGEVPMRYIEVNVSGPFEFMFDYPMTDGTMTLQGHAELRLR